MVTGYIVSVLKLNCNLIQKQPSSKKSVRPPHWEKKVKSKVVAKNGCNGRLIAKILISTIQVNLCCLSMFHYDLTPNSPELLLLKFFAISLPSQPFLAATFIFFHNGLLGGHTLFLQLGCFWIKFHFFL